MVCPGNKCPTNLTNWIKQPACIIDSIKSSYGMQIETLKNTSSDHGVLLMQDISLLLGLEHQSTYMSSIWTWPGHMTKNINDVASKINEARKLMTVCFVNHVTLKCQVFKMLDKCDVRSYTL
jgi:hypothetical protein